MEDKNIDLNFIPGQFEDFRIYRKEYEVDTTENFYIKRMRLPVSLSDDSDTKEYSISFDNSLGGEEFICHETTNRNLTREYLFFILETRIKSIGIYNYQAFNMFNKRIEICTESHKIGKETIVIEPYILKRPNKRIGVLIDYKFRPLEEYKNSIECQKLSLSLDRFGQSNKNFYSDKYEKLVKFIKSYSDIFDVEGIRFEDTFKAVESNSLSTKRYLFGTGEGTSQFQGLLKYQPYRKIDKDKSIRLVFIYEEKNRFATNQLYEALIGKSYKYTFSGFEEMFKFNIDLNSIERIRIKEYSPAALDEISEKVVSLKKDYDFLILITIYSKAQEDVYYKLKYIACKNGIPLQGITTELIEKADGLKWSTSNIALGIFAKLNGIPWIMKTENKKSIIFGLGEAHKRNKDDEIEKYLAYSVCLDSTGLYRNINVLSNELDKMKYLDSLKSELQKILSELDIDSIDNCVLHIPHRMKYGEYEAVKEVIEKYASTNIEFVVIKINDESPFFGFAQNNCKTPYESSYIQIDYNEYLMWFEGLQYGKENVTKRVGGPLHVSFVYSNKEIDNAHQKIYLQDLINLSGANWRGFNSKNLPISIYYPKLISKFIANFRQYFEEEISIKDLNEPWFL